MIHKRTTLKIFTRAKELRHDPTPAEIKLWARLRAHGMADVHFRNQHAIGNYIVDFCAPRRKLIIELDGSQHFEQEKPGVDMSLKEKDRSKVINEGKNILKRSIQKKKERV